ncbi:glycosyltransferase [Paenibacillus harenae]|uniref:glycosyltransferase n=1 Tax=Paenibacillus harenae TaxID=306543 RepID=UPI0004246038|nr:glycosyltransferase [Paenibacillus harenae]
MSKKISVIVPVYNAEPYIGECLQSLLAQTLQDCEFICVNDGSTDRSASIIEQFRQMDSRVILINQSNQGVSVARNTGLEDAAGEYVGFVDADDFIEPDMYERLYNAAGKGDCDVVLSNFESELDGYRIVTQYPFPTDVVLHSDFIRREVLPTFLRTDQLNTACNKIYRTSLIQKYKIRFPENVTLGEDGLFNMMFFSCAASMNYISYTGYHYREVKGSATRNIASKDYFQRALEVYESKLPDSYAGLLDQRTIKELKSIKLIQSVLAYIHIYLKPSKEMGIIHKFRYVRKMIRNQEVRSSLPIYCKEMAMELGVYQKAMLQMMRRKSILGLYGLTAYSRFRNKN